LTSETYARGDEQVAAGGVIIAAISILAAVLVIAGLAYATGIGGRHQAALAAAGCEPNLSPNGLPCTTAHVLTREYMQITTPAIQQLNADVAAYSASEWHNRTAAEAALKAEVTSATGLDASLARFPFPPAVAARARALIRAIHVRVTLTAEQARSSSLARMRSFDRRADVASAAIETDFPLVLKALESPPTSSQEP
jgi:hypothetical protein